MQTDALPSEPPGKPIYNIYTYKLYIKREREVSFSNWLPKLWELASVKSAGLAIRWKLRQGF